MGGALLWHFGGEALTAEPYTFVPDTPGNQYRGDCRTGLSPDSHRVVHLLTTKVGISDDEIRKFSRAETIARLEMYWTHGS